MTNDEAVEVARLVDDLWGVGRGEAWVAFYGAGIASLDREDALRAVAALFRSERFYPTPEQVLETASGTSPSTALADLRSDGPIDPAVRRAALAVWGSLVAVPWDRALSGGEWDRWVTALREARRTRPIQPELEAQ